MEGQNGLNIVYNINFSNSLLSAHTLVVHDDVLQLSGDGSKGGVQVNCLDVVVYVNDGDVGLLPGQGAKVNRPSWYGKRIKSVLTLTA